MIDEEFEDDDIIDEPESEEDDGSEEESEQEVNDSGEEEESEEGEEDDAAAERERKRQERKDKKERKRAYIEQQKNEMSRIKEDNKRLAQAIAAIENRGIQSEYQQVKSAMSEAQLRYNDAEKIFNTAKTEGDFNKAFEAQDAMNKIKNAYTQLSQSEANLLEQAKAKANPPPAALNPQAIQLRTQWLSKYNNFQNTSLTDRQDIEQIDALVYSKGYKPDTEAYWNELDRRLKVGLPQLFRDKPRNSEVKRPSSSMVGSAAQSAARNSQITPSLTKAHIQAAKEAGLWNDPKLREQFIARVKKESKANR